MKVRDIMRPALSVPPETPVTSVASTLVEQGVAGIPVTDEGGRVLGIVSETDMVTKHAQVHVPTYLGILGGVIPIGRHHADEEVRRVLAVTASDLMSDVGATLAPDADVDEAATLMVDEGVDPVLILDGDRLVGLVDRRDIIRLLIVEEAGASGASGTNG